MYTELKKRDTIRQIQFYKHEIVSWVNSSRFGTFHWVISLLEQKLMIQQIFLCYLLTYKMYKSSAYLQKYQKNCTQAIPVAKTSAKPL